MCFSDVVSCEATCADIVLPLHFQTGEVWEEVSKELEAEGVEPVAFDQTLLQEISQITEAKSEQVLEAQVSTILVLHTYVHYDNVHFPLLRYVTPGCPQSRSSNSVTGLTAQRLIS